MGFTAGFTGEALEKAVSDKGIKSDFIRLSSGNTRINVKLKGGAETEINAAGPQINKDELNRLFEKLNDIKNGDTLLLAGSVPNSLPANIYEQIALAVQNRGVRLVVDATGDLLLKVLKYKPFLIKPNRQELEEIIGEEIKTEEQLISTAKELLKMGLHISFTGVVTFKNARKAIEALKVVPMDRLMIETDCPYMAPEPYRGKRNYSGYVIKVAEKIAEVKGMTVEDVALQTMKTAKTLFGIL